MTLTPEQLEQLNDELPTLRLPYCPHDPTVKQEFFLLRDELEVFFGGAAGPGKSWGLLMAALQYVDVAGYHALLLRPSLTEFEQQGGLIEHSHDWLGGSDAWWHGGRREWKFPSGATVRFGYLANVTDLNHYKGGAVSFVGFDELTSWPDPRLYLGMFRIVRQAVGQVIDPLTGRQVPGRVRSASNPGGPGHDWVKERFIDELAREPHVVYVPAWITDNPHLDYDAYLRTLEHMHPVDRERLIRGDWDVVDEGDKFKRLWFPVEEPASPVVRRVRYWDLAGTEPSPTSPDPDYTVGLLYESHQDGTFTIRDIVRGRWSDDRVENVVRQTADGDRDRFGVGATDYYIEQDPGQAGKAQLTNYKRRVLQGYAVHAGQTRINGRAAAKEVRARPVAAAAGNGLVRIAPDCPNRVEFVGEVVRFPNASHDDCVDALSGAHNSINARGRRTTTLKSYVPRGQIPVRSTGSAAQPAAGAYRPGRGTVRFPRQ